MALGRAARDSPPPPPGGVPPARHGCTCAGPRARAPRPGPRRSPQPRAAGCRPARTHRGCRKRSFIHYLRALIGLGRACCGRMRGRHGDPSVRGRVRTCGKVCRAGGRSDAVLCGRALSRAECGGCGPHAPPLHGPRRRVPDAALASFIIIFGQVECARNSCFTRLTSEGGYSGNQENE